MFGTSHAEIGSSNPWLTCFDKRPRAQTRLICFAHAGGAASAFAQWHRDLPPSVELCAVSLPGRDVRRSERARTRFADLLSELVEGLATAHDRPVVLLGYSLGALFAFEYARALRLMTTRTAAPTHLIVAARKAPQLTENVPIPISRLSDADFVRAMSQRYDGIPKPILADPEVLSYFLPVMRADMALLESYAYQSAAPLACGITALGGSLDPRVSRADLDAWSSQTTGAFETLQFPGGHFFVTPDQRSTVLGSIATLCRG